MKLGVITHFFNEEMMLPYWLDHHKKYFDCAIGINHHSTDKSVDIWNEKTNGMDEWVGTDTNMPMFQAGALDVEVMQAESYMKQKFAPDFILVLNTTEFLFTPNLRDVLEDLQDDHPITQAFGMNSVVLVDPDHARKFLQGPDWKLHHHGYVDNKYETRRPRYIHSREHGHYETGRHNVYLPKIVIPEMLILWWGFAPWPACKYRKLQIQTRIPQSDKDARLGWEHIQTDESLTEMYRTHLAKSYNLMEDKVYETAYTSL